MKRITLIAPALLLCLAVASPTSAQSPDPLACTIGLPGGIRIVLRLVDQTDVTAEQCASASSGGQYAGTLVHTSELQGQRQCGVDLGQMGYLWQEVWADATADMGTVQLLCAAVSQQGSPQAAGALTGQPDPEQCANTRQAAAAGVTGLDVLLQDCTAAGL